MKELIILSSLLTLLRVQEGTGERAVKESEKEEDDENEGRGLNERINGCRVRSHCLTEVKNKEEGNRVEGSS